MQFTIVTILVGLLALACFAVVIHAAWRLYHQIHRYRKEDYNAKND